MIGRTISHYRILSKLGEGGMGVVYLAEDIHLHRKVALKFLSPDRSTDPVGRRKFLQEAQAASALNHPNIVTIYEIETVENTAFIAMELVEGENLRKKIPKGGMPLEEALSYAIPAAEALAAAHQSGLVHRDIKPANIMVSVKGTIKLLDFGLAKIERLPQGSEDSLTVTRLEPTKAGALTGTIAYMAPEQARGQTADARSDVYSFGVVLFQMVTGRLPFSGGNDLEVLYAISTAPIPPVRSLRPELPDEFEQILTRALERDREKRYGSMDELVADLKRLASGLTIEPPKPAPVRIKKRRALQWIGAALAALAIGVVGWFVIGRLKGPAEEKKIAVLPFRNVGDSASNTAFCDGLLEVMSSNLTQLGQVHGGLWVVPASEIRTEKVDSAQQAQRIFGVNLVVTGSVQRAEGQVRLTMNLVDALSRRQLSSHEVVRREEQLAGLEEEVTGLLAEMLRLELRPEVRRGLGKDQTAVSGAYDLYVQGRGRLQRGEEGDLEQATELFQRALAMDGKYAQAYAGLGEAYWQRYRTTKDAKWAKLAVDNCQQGVKLAPDRAAVLVSLAMTQEGTGEVKEAAKTFERAIALDPSSMAAQEGLGRVYESLGDQKKAESIFRRLNEMHPGTWRGLWPLGTYYFRRGRYKEAEPLFSEIVAIAPDNSRAQSNLAVMHWNLGRYDQAAELFERVIKLRPTATAYTNLGSVYVFQGRCSDAIELMEKAKGMRPKDEVLWGNLGDAYACAGEKEKARQAYDEAIRLCKERLPVNPKNPEVLGNLGMYFARTGNFAEAIPLTERAIEYGAQSRSVQWHAAIAFELGGQRERALLALDEAVKRGQQLAEVRREPAFEKMRTDPRYQKVIEQGR